MLNSASLDADGYYCTGDIGRVDAHGMLFILGRCEEVLATRRRWGRTCGMPSCCVRRAVLLRAACRLVACGVLHAASLQALAARGGGMVLPAPIEEALCQVLVGVGSALVRRRAACIPLSRFRLAPCACVCARACVCWHAVRRFELRRSGVCARVRAFVRVCLRGKGVGERMGYGLGAKPRGLLGHARVVGGVG
jgi:acyl-CoA synthetase (AMP-forming)/AMP-acid ligase II